jgi:hypothetical protein
VNTNSRRVQSENRDTTRQQKLKLCKILVRIAAIFGHRTRYILKKAAKKYDQHSTPPHRSSPTLGHELATMHRSSSCLIKLSNSWASKSFLHKFPPLKTLAGERKTPAEMFYALAAWSSGPRPTFSP